MLITWAAPTVMRTWAGARPSRATWRRRRIRKVVGDQWEALWRKRLEATPAIMRTWTTHQTYDSYWKRGSIATDYSAITCPVYVVDGWGDPYGNIIGELLAGLKVPRKGLIGPWGHIFPNLATPLGLDWPYEEVRWWQQWLAGVETGIMAEPMLRVYMMYKADSEAFPDEVPGRWVAEATWPSPRIESTNCTSMRAAGCRRSRMLTTASNTSATRSSA